jgi:hypothetical protein
MTTTVAPRTAPRSANAPARTLVLLHHHGPMLFGHRPGPVTSPPLASLAHRVLLIEEVVGTTQ